MRLNYYQFPDGVDAQTRSQNGAADLENACLADAKRWRSMDNPSDGCPHKTGGGGCRECGNLCCTEAEYEVCGISVSRAKELLKRFGGTAYTRHIDRDGGCFETTPITLTGNNSRHKYNRHL